MSLFWSGRASIDRFRAGDPEVLSVVYWHYVGKVERLLSAGVGRSGGRGTGGIRHSPADLADLVQEVFLRAFSRKSRESYDGVRDYGPYLYAIARNVLADWGRTRGREIPSSGMELEGALEAAPAPYSLAPWETPATMYVVEAYLAKLPDELRAIHRLRHEEGLSQQQAADRLGVGRQTLRTLERRLQDGLAAALDAAGIGVTSDSEPIQVQRDREQDPIGGNDAQVD